MKKVINETKLQFPSLSVNESFARTAVSAFVLPMDPTIEELSDIKTAVSEAVTNCIVHAYPNTVGVVILSARLYEDRTLVLTVKDKGVGIEDVEKAMQPQYTTSAAQERSGIGFSVMEAFMDSIKVRSIPGKGTSVTMKRRIKQRSVR